MSLTPSLIPRPVAAGQPLSAAAFNLLVEVANKQQARIERLEALLSDNGKVVRRVPAFIVSSTTDTPSTYGGTSYTVRAVGGDPGGAGDLLAAKPVNRIIDDDDMPVTPAADNTPCVIVRAFDATGNAISWLELWEKHPAVVCEEAP